MHFPSGEKATDKIGAICPFKSSPIYLPTSAFHVLIVLSELPETIFLPSGEN